MRAQARGLIFLVVIALPILQGCATCGEMSREECQQYKADIRKARATAPLRRARTDSERMNHQMPAWQSQVYHPMKDPLFKGEE